MDDINWTSTSTFALADELKVCLEAALYDGEIEISVPDGYMDVPGFYPDNIRINKLAYLTIEDLGLPLIRTWYKYGQYEPYKSLRAERIEPAPLKQPDKKVAVTPTGKEITRNTIYGYLQNRQDEIKNMWEMSLFEFMRYNYSQYAPEGFEDEYMNNTGILEIFERIYKNQGTPWEFYEEFKNYSMNLRYELDDNEMIPDWVFNHVREFLYTFEDVLVGYESIRDPSPSQSNFIRNSRNVYHQHIWALPTLVLSKSHVEGPRSEIGEYRRVVDKYFENQSNLLPIALQDWRDKVIGLELLPTDKSKRTLVGGPPDELARLERASVTKNGSG